MKARRRVANLTPRVMPASLSRTQVSGTWKRDELAQQRKRFYDSALWQRTREAKLRRDPFCQCCDCEGMVTVGVHVDHWIALAQGGHPTADDNLVTMCVSHHSQKTHVEQHGGELPKFTPSKTRSIALA